MPTRSRHVRYRPTHRRAVHTVLETQESISGKSASIITHEVCPLAAPSSLMPPSAWPLGRRTFLGFSRQCWRQSPTEEYLEDVWDARLQLHNSAVVSAVIVSPSASLVFSRSIVTRHTIGLKSGLGATLFVGILAAWGSFGILDMTATSVPPLPRTTEPSNHARWS